MPRRRKQIRFEEGGDEDWSGSSSNSSTSSIASFHRESYPKNGKTRIPAKLVSKRALIDLGYPFVDEGATIVLLVALDERLINEVLRLSEEYRRSDAEIESQIEGKPIDYARDQGFDWVNVELPAEEGSLRYSAHDEASDNDLDSAFGDVGHDEHEGPVAHSGVLSLNTTKASGENAFDLTAGRFPSWNQEKSELINGTTHLYSVHAAEFYMDRAGNQRVTLVCPNDPGNGLMFLSAPHLILAERTSRKRYYGKHCTRSLSEVLYGYDNGSHESSRIIQGENQDSTTLQVPQLWSLVVGTDLIITSSELSSEEVQKDLITIDGIDSETGIYTIRLIDEKDTFRYNIVIKPDCKYVDFLRHAVSLVSKGRSNAAACDLVDDSGVLITADAWLRLLAEGSIEEYVFCLRPRHAGHKSPDEDFRALSARLTAGSRSSLGRYSRPR
ncbi:uncharacterized protein LY79DRAFT_514187 [Colletotrichum navitas]|uniref:DUF8035 domain-containing protein n=1 Tax=Colletotrichum navitas TaxID=681940 RepID=A0AAD8Q108_9PEZI|nr:uncharacterized protein LY79DRAFT_514187 [Colletotrichum navitas]KAK1593484.1 hypothetical protein LY79DRAFT_514187 [Colletotrichum navitas]